MDAINMIRVERARICSSPQDSKYLLGELVEAANFYLFTAQDDFSAASVSWPWDLSRIPKALSEPGGPSRLECLAKAGALIVMEIERTQPQPGNSPDDCAYAAIAEAIGLFSRSTGTVGRIRDLTMRKAAIELLQDYAVHLANQMRAEIDQLTHGKGVI